MRGLVAVAFVTPQFLRGNTMSLSVTVTDDGDPIDADSNGTRIRIKHRDTGNMASDTTLERDDGDSGVYRVDFVPTVAGTFDFRWDLLFDDGARRLLVEGTFTITEPRFDMAPPT